MVLRAGTIVHVGARPSFGVASLVATATGGAGPVMDVADTLVCFLSLFHAQVASALPKLTLLLLIRREMQILRRVGFFAHESF